MSVRWLNFSAWFIPLVQEERQLVSRTIRHCEWLDCVELVISL